MKEDVRIPPGMEGFSIHVKRRRSELPSHHHDELEVNLVLNGHANYLFGHRRVRLTAQSMIWLFPEQEHVLMDWSDDFSMWVMMFRPTLVHRLAHSGQWRILSSRDPGEIFCRQIEAHRVEHLRQVYLDASDGDGMEARNAALGYGLVASWQAYQFSIEPPPPFDVHPAVARAARLISEADGSPGLEVLAREAGLSPARLSRLFKQQAGISLTAFRQRKCVERFLRLYGRGTRYTLLQAALEAGFGSYAQFHHVFADVMRMSPSAYRKSLRADGAKAPAK
jgi:AraC-like DNA-binding protein